MATQILSWDCVLDHPVAPAMDIVPNALLWSALRVW